MSENTTGDGDVCTSQNASEAQSLLIDRLFEAAPGGVVHVSPEGVVLRANEAARAFLGMGSDLDGSPTKEFSGRTFYENGTLCPVEAYPVTQALRSGQAHGPMVIGVEQPNGEIRWGSFRARPLQPGGFAGVVVTFLDITERRVEQQEREHMRTQLRVADRLASMGTLAAGVAHEVNNPLTYVIGNLERLAARVTDAETAAALAQALEGAHRVRDIIATLGSFSRFSDEDHGPFDVRRALQSALAMARVELRHRARLVVALDAVPAAWGSQPGTVQVFLNLLVNAAQAIPEGHVDEHEIQVRAHTVGTEVCVEIVDDGSGMDTTTLDRAFDPFFTTKPVGEGTGLGLAISHGIITSMDGRLELDSTLGEGTTARVYLPLATTPIRARTPAPPPRRAPVARARVLIVDDESDIIDILRWFLDGFEVGSAANGREALALCASGDWDAIVCDLMMPVLTGMEFYRELRRTRPDLADRIVFMTGGAYTAEAREFLDDVEVPVLTKPFGRQDVLERLALMLGEA